MAQPTVGAQTNWRARRDAIRPLFDRLDADERDRAWLARKIGISRARLYAYEIGRNWPPEWVISSACAALNIPRSTIPAWPPTPTKRKRDPPHDTPSDASTSHPTQKGASHHDRQGRRQSPKPQQLRVPGPRT